MPDITFTTIPQYDNETIAVWDYTLYDDWKTHTAIIIEIYETMEDCGGVTSEMKPGLQYLG